MVRWTVENDAWRRGRRARFNARVGPGMTCRMDASNGFRIDQPVSQAGCQSASQDESTNRFCINLFLFDFFRNREIYCFDSFPHCSSTVPGASRFIRPASVDRRRTHARFPAPLSVGSSVRRFPVARPARSVRNTARCALPERSVG